jgi:RNA polymerase sigma-70 factor (ECF subfamily)
MKESSAETPGSSLWPMTDWSGVGHAATAVGKDPDRLNRLILTYRVPLKVYLLSTFPALTNQADELLQDFAQDKILREGWLGKADRDRGRFRDFLKTSLKHFIHDHLRKASKAPASLDELEFDPPAKEPSAELFDLNWARAILSETLARMENDCRTPGIDQPRRAQIWELFQLRVVYPALEGAELLGYEDLVSRFGLATPFEAHNMLATAKRIFTRHLNGVIADYEGGGQAARFELDEIKRSLSCLSKKRKR